MTKKLLPFLLVLFCTAISALAQTARIPVKNVAVIETQIDVRSAAASVISSGEVGVITNQIRSEAVNNLPRNRFNVMTSETVQSMGAAVLEECAEENCVIALGSKIGADYIVRAVIGTFGDNLTVSIEMYETEYGMLVATDSRVRSADLNELLEKTMAACAVMYKRFLETSGSPAAPQVVLTRVPERGGQKSAGRGYDSYFAVRWMPVVVAEAVRWSMLGTEMQMQPDLFRPFSFNLETGLVWGKGTFLGIDVGGGGYDNHSRNDMGVLGLNFGSAYEMSSELKFVYGVYGGVWYDFYERYGSGNTTRYYYFGPFARLRWNYLELYNRLLIGNGVCYQAGIGLYFEGSKRHRQ